MTYVGILTAVHTALSLISLGLGLPAILILFNKPLRCCWTKWFLITAVATSVTGYFFPFNGVTPAIIVGVIALASLAVTIAAKCKFHFAGPWRWVYAGGIVLNVWLLVFVTIAQAFQKVPALQALAPTGKEPPFGIAEGTGLLIFVVIGIIAMKKFIPTGDTCKK